MGGLGISRSRRWGGKRNRWVTADSSSREEWGGRGITALDKTDVEELDNLVRLIVEKLVGFGVQGVADKDAFVRACINFGIVLVLDQNESMASNFIEVGKVRLCSKPEFIRHPASALGWHLGKKVTGHHGKFVPAVQE